MAKYLVTSEQHYRITGQLLEIQRQLRTKGGSPIDPEDIRQILQGAIEPGYGNKKEETGILKTLESLRTSGYLDTSFEGKEVHRLVIDPLSKGQAFAAYRASGGKTWIWDEMEKNIPYTVPKAGILDVFILGFGKAIGSDEGFALIDKLGVRPLVFEEHLQLGIKKPAYQEKNPLVALTRYFLDGYPRAPILLVVGAERGLRADVWGDAWGVRYRFPVVRKEKPGDYNYFLDS